MAGFYNIRKATQGLANYLNASDLPKKVAIGYDSRIKSDVFAEETAAVLAIGYFVWNRVTEVKPDHTVAVVGRADPDAAFLSELETKLEQLAEDVNGDGKIKVSVKSIWLAVDYDVQDVSLRELMKSSEDKLNADFYLGESVIFIVDDPAGMEQVYGCFRLLDGTDPQEGDMVSVDDFAIPLEETTLAGTKSESGAEWYMARRLKEGMDEDSISARDELWEKIAAF